MTTQVAAATQFSECKSKIDSRQAHVAVIGLGYVGLPVAATFARAGHPVTVRTTIRNLSTRPFPAQATYGRRLVRMGAQLCARDGSVVNRDFERAWLPATLQPSSSVDVQMTLTAPEKPGRYGLKFDLVSEGIDWFEACGSQTTTKSFVVIK